MSAHSHAQRLKMMQQQQQAQQLHRQQYHPVAQQRASLPSVAYSGAPSTSAGYAGQPVPQPRTSVGSYAPSAYEPGMTHAHSHGSLASQPVSVSTFGGGYGYNSHAPRRSTGNRYINSNLKTSKSLGGSRASLASVKSGKSTIQQECHDKRVRAQMSTVWFGKARFPFYIALACFVVGGILVIGGSVWTGLAHQGRIFIPIDNARAIGPIILALGILACGIGLKFFYDAYTVSNAERRRLKFRAHNASMVSVNTVGSKKEEVDETLISGRATKDALTRTPHGSRMSLSGL